MACEPHARAWQMVSPRVASPADRSLLSSCSCAEAGGAGEAQEWRRRRRRRRGGEEKRVASGGREQAVGGGVLPALHALLAHALPRRRRPLQALRGTSSSSAYLIHLIVKELLVSGTFEILWSVCSWKRDWILEPRTPLCGHEIAMRRSWIG